MKIYHFIKIPSMVLTMLSLALVTTMSMAADYQKIAGQFKQAYVKQEVLPVPHSQNHIIMLTQANGVNTDINKNGFMPGAKVVIQEIADLNQGNGPHSGYVTQTMENGDVVVVKIQGNVSTVMSAEGLPNTSVKGDWVFDHGSGKYNGISGSGTYTGYFTSEKEFTVDWNGYYFVQ